MAQIILTDVTYVHAAAQDSKPGAVLPPMYRVGDVVRVDRANGTAVEVKLCLADEANGQFEGIVLASTADDVKVDAEVVFQYR
jgi:hypothetical protein